MYAEQAIDERILCVDGTEKELQAKLSLQNLSCDRIEEAPRCKEADGPEALLGIGESELRLLRGEVSRVPDIRSHQRRWQSASEDSKRHGLVVGEGALPSGIQDSVSELQRSHGVLRSLPSPDCLYHYCIVRRDLPVGVIAAQLIHAAGESSPGNLPEATRAVALAVPDEKSLLDLETSLSVAGVSFKSIREPDPPYYGALMAIGLVPQHKTPLLKQLLGKLPLVK